MATEKGAMTKVLPNEELRESCLCILLHTRVTAFSDSVFLYPSSVPMCSLTRATDFDSVLQFIPDKFLNPEQSQHELPVGSLF